MLNIHELERTWLRYKIKRYIPRIAVALSIVIISGIAYWAYDTPEDISTTEPHDISEIANTIPPIVETEKEIAIVPVPAKPPVVKTIKPAAHDTIVQATPKQKDVEIPAKAKDEKSVTILRPSMGFMHAMEDEARESSSERALKTPVRPTVTTQAVKKTVVAKPVKETPPHIEEVPEKSTIVSKPKKSSISIIAKQDEEDIKDVIRRFKKNKNPALSLFIARQYYKTERYQKAYNYALITNNINSDIEDSWLIFARSLVKLDQKKMAKKALSSYIDTSDSARAKILLDEIIHGEFR